LIFLGFLFLEAQKLFDYGFKQYFLDWSNVFNLVKCILYLCYLGLEYFTIATVVTNIKIISNESFWERISNISVYDYEEQKKMYKIFYMLNAGK
jgi:hypothetical protein